VVIGGEHWIEDLGDLPSVDKERQSLIEAFCADSERRQFQQLTDPDVWIGRKRLAQAVRRYSVLQFHCRWLLTPTTIIFCAVICLCRSRNLRCSSASVRGVSAPRAGEVALPGNRYTTNETDLQAKHSFSPAVDRTASVAAMFIPISPCLSACASSGVGTRGLAGLYIAIGDSGICVSPDRATECPGPPSGHSALLSGWLIAGHVLPVREGIVRACIHCATEDAGCFRACIGTRLCCLLADRCVFLRSGLNGG
jgi:hypothetical protein